jgi:hypothetical protein
MNLRPNKPLNGIDELKFVLDGDTIRKVKSLVESFTEQEWTEWQHRQKNYKEQKHTNTIRCRWLENNIDEYHERLSVDFDTFNTIEHILGNVFTFIKRHYQGKICQAILTRQNPHSLIVPHIDLGKKLTYTHRLHIPIFTNDDILFRCGEQNMNMKVGRVYEINNQMIHAVVNNSDSFKIHLIVDVIEDRYIGKKFVPSNPLFVHVPKTAGTSIEKSLNLQSSVHWKKEPKYVNHDPLFLLQQTNHISNDTYIFSVVRNPFTRAYSYYCHFKRINGVELTFRDFLQIVRNRVPVTNKTPLVGFNQSYFLFGNDGLMGIDKIYFFENLLELELDFDVQLQKMNVGDYSYERYYLDYGKEEQNLVRHIYAEDFMNFGYSLEFQ